MEIRRTTETDIPRLQEIFAYARRFMAGTGNPSQWTDGYPSVAQIMEDIRRNESYVCLSDGQIVGTFVMRTEKDPTYDVIYDGAWKNDNPYATIHRIATFGQVRGLFNEVMRFALQTLGTVRIDTHRDNKVMRHIVEKAGFRYCGIIHCWNGDERLAYQYN